MKFTSNITPKSISLKIACAFFLLVALRAAAVTSDFSVDWRFLLGDVATAAAVNFTDASWDKVNLPHTARIEALVTDTGAKQQWEGICWYRKTFKIPAEAKGQVVLLRFEGAMNLAQLYVNGDKIAEHADGYLPFVVDISTYAKDDKTITLAMRLDNRHSELTGPKPLEKLDFHLYHGLYRKASLIIKPALHITDEIMENTPASGGVFVTYPQVSEKLAVINSQVHIRNSGAQDASFTILTRLSELDGKEVLRKESTSLTLASGVNQAFNSQLELKNPSLWSPQTPHLYNLDIALIKDGKTIDSQRERIGIRRFSVEAGGILINGKKLVLRGVNHHQEYPYVGNAVPANAQYRDAYKMKQAGFDFVRLAHTPHSPEFLAACDELGLVVMNPILGWQFNPATPAFMENRIQASHTLIRRDRNHACVLLWELSLNETRMTPEFVKQLHAAGHEEFPGDQMIVAGWLDGYDVKVTARQHGSTKEFLNATTPCLVSEYGDWEYYGQDAGFNQDAWKGLKKAERNSRQLRGDGEVRLLQQATNIQEAHNENLSTKAFADGYWVMYDYNRGYASDLEASGIMDIFRLPKFSHAFFQSQRKAEEVYPFKVGGPQVFIASYWNEKSPLAVRIFSNCEEVELFLNDKSLGRQKPDVNAMSANLAHPTFTFKVARFQKGTLKAVAYLKGKVVTQHSVATPEAPTRIALAADLSGKPLGTGGDLVFVYARIIDDEGTLVSDSSLPVKFSLEGEAQLIGDNPIAAEAGIATILVKTGDKPGSLRIKAEAGELDSRLKLKVE